MSAYDRNIRALHSIAAKQIERIHDGEEHARSALGAVFWAIALIEEAKEQGVLEHLVAPAVERKIKLRQSAPRPRRLFTRGRLRDFAERLRFQGFPEASDAALALADLIPAEFSEEQADRPERTEESERAAIRERSL